MKYKILSTTSRKTGANRNDIYQMLAYLTATGLADGVLVYAGIAAHDEVITVGTSEQRIHIISVDLSAENSRSMLLNKVGIHA